MSDYMKSGLKPTGVETLEDIQKLSETLIKSRLNQKGYIMMPDFNGFKLYEIDENRLNLYLQAEGLHQQNHNKK